ncbi:hypothetical protein HDU67_000327, partial [Dinochytrium kinnereticum]
MMAAAANTPLHPDDAAAKDNATSSTSWAFKASYPYLVTPKKLRGVRWALWFFIGGVLVIGVLFAASSAQVNFNKRVRTRGADFYASPLLAEICSDQETADPEIIAGCQEVVFATITPVKWDPSSFTLSVQYDLAFGRTLADELGRLKTNSNVIFDAAYSSKIIKPRERANMLTVDIPVGVDISQYPFEVYNVQLFAVPVESLPEGGRIIPQVTDLVLNNLPSFAFDTPSVNASEPTAMFNVSFRRTPVVKIVVIFTWVVMHLWVIIVVFLTAQVIYRDREPQALMAWVATSVFSMGTIRAAQPIAPAVGTTADMVTYIWAIMIIALSSFICFIFNFR